MNAAALKAFASAVRRHLMARKQSSINSSIMVLHVAGCFTKVQDVPILTQPLGDKQLNVTP